MLLQTSKRFVPTFFACATFGGFLLFNQPTTFAQTPTLSTEQWSMVNLINKIRAQNGAGPLAVSITLQNASQWMANDMATNNYFGYRDSLRRAPGTRLQAFGYNAYWGENITNGFSDAQNSLNQWLLECSPDQTGACTYASRTFLTDPSWVVMGIGRASNANSQAGWYWTLDMGQYKDATISQGIAPPPVISSFVATPSTINGGSTTLLWNIVGATTVSIDNNIGDVSNTTFKAVSPTKTTTYKLTATNSSGSLIATTTVTVNQFDTQAPTPPALITALPKSANQVDLTWSNSIDNVGVTGYQVIRNSNILNTVSGATLNYSDNTAAASSTYNYQIRAFDAAGNLSSASNTLQATTPAFVISNCPNPGNGVFTGCYFSGIGLSGTPSKTTTDPTIMFDWSNAFAGRPAPMSNFSVRWQGNFNFTSGNYTFNTVTSDGMRVYIDDPKTPVLDSWKDQAPTFYSFPKTLSGNHLIIVEFYNKASGWPISYVWWNKQ